VYCYEDSAFETFQSAATCGAQKFYELPIGYYEEARAVADEEVKREKALCSCFISLHEPQEKLVRKRLEVLSADHIICASTYCCSTLRKYVDVPGRISVLPYGCDCSSIPRTWSASDFRGPLKLVFIGRLEPRKGLHYLFQALENLVPGCFMLTLAGRWVPGYREWLLGRYRIEFRELGQISRSQALELMGQSDLLVFPSLFEGFGLVLLEAMGCGIPILASERTGAPDIIEDKREGFLVRAGCSEDIARVLWHVLDERRELAEMGIEAHRRAMSLSWRDYRRRLGALVTSDVQCA
jgi:glycosyltransferase involved in cell wall biosynthesis